MIAQHRYRTCSPARCARASTPPRPAGRRLALLAPCWSPARRRRSRTVRRRSAAGRGRAVAVPRAARSAISRTAGLAARARRFYRPILEPGTGEGARLRGARFTRASVVVAARTRCRPDEPHPRVEDAGQVSVIPGPVNGSSGAGARTVEQSREQMGRRRQQADPQHGKERRGRARRSRAGAPRTENRGQLRSPAGASRAAECIVPRCTSMLSGRKLSEGSQSRSCTLAASTAAARVRPDAAPGSRRACRRWQQRRESDCPSSGAV